MFKVILIALLLICAFTVIADDSLNVKLVGSFVMMGIPRSEGVCADIFYAYLCAGFDGIRIIDYADPSNPVEVGYNDDMGFPNDVYASDGYVFTADGATDIWGLYVIDISSPDAPTMIGHSNSTAAAYGVFAEGSYAYIAASNAGLRVIDISTPSSPIEVGSFDTDSYAKDVFVVGSYAYVADANDGLRIIDVSNPSSPDEVGYFDTEDYAEDVFVLGDYAYVADESDGLRIIDVSTPSSPVEVGGWSSAFIKGVYVDSCFAYTIVNGGLIVLDVSNPASPVQVGYYASSSIGMTTDIYVIPPYAFISDYEHGLFILDVSYFTGVEIGPHLLSVFPPEGCWTSVDTTIVFSFYDADGVDTLSAELTVNGVTYAASDEELTVTGDSLIFRPSTPWADGTVTAVITYVADTLGNVSSDIGRSFSFFVDKTPPMLTFREPDSADILDEAPSGLAVSFYDSGCGWNDTTWLVLVNGDSIAPDYACVNVYGDTVLCNLFSCGITIYSGDTATVEFAVWDVPDIGPPNRRTYEWWFMLVSGIGEKNLPEEIGLSVWPNPFNSALNIALRGVGATERSPGQIAVEIFDINGRSVYAPSPSVPLPKGEGGQVLLPPGEGGSKSRMRAFTWQPDESLSSGVYLIRARVGDKSVTKKILYLK